MFSLKTKIKVDELGLILYNYTVNHQYLDNTVDSLDKTNVLERNNIKSEIIVLIIVTVDYLLSSPKICKSLGEKNGGLFINYLGYFKEVTGKQELDDFFIDLLNKRGNMYNALIQNDNLLNNLNSPYQIAEAFSKNCGVENDPIFIIKALNIFSSNLKILSELLAKFKLI